MQEPNPILGLHAAPGAVAWAQVQRGPDGSFRVLDWGTEPVPDDAAAAVARASEVAARRAFRRRGAYLALPDGSGCLVTATLSPDELDLTGEDLARELHEHTPFEPGVASLRSSVAREDDRRREIVVAAIPSAQERRFVDAATPHDDGTLGLGFATAAAVRGARALGHVGDHGFLVEMLPRTTHVVALEGKGARRYLLPFGATDVIEAAARALSRDAADLRRAVDSGSVDAATQRALDAAAADLAADVRGVAEYHQSLDARPKDAPRDSPIVPNGAFLSRAPLRRALAAHLGAGFAEVPAQTAPAARITWDRAPGDSAIAVAGAVGAALEAFDVPDARLALRPPPREVSPPSSASPWMWAAGALVVLAAAGAVWWQRQGPETRPTPPTVREPEVGGGREQPVEPPVEEPTTPAPADERAPRPPVLRAKAASDGSVALTWSGGDPESAWRLRRLDPGAATWIDLDVAATADGGEIRDQPPGASGTYRYRFHAAASDAPAGDEATVDLTVPVTYDLLGVADDGVATFHLVRRWNGRNVTADVAVARERSVSAQVDVGGVAVSLAPGLTLVEARVRDDVEVVQVPLPEFGPDGRVVRGAGGSVPRLLRDVRRTYRVHEAVLRAADGRNATVSRKMTDG